MLLRKPRDRHPSQYPELSASQLLIATPRPTKNDQLTLKGGRILDPAIKSTLDMSTFDSERTDTPFHARFALGRLIGLRPQCYGQQRVDTGILARTAEMMGRLELGKLERLALDIIARGVNKRHNRQLEAEQAELDALLKTASVEGEPLWVAGDYGSGQRRGESIFAAPLLRAVITQDEVPRVQPVVCDREGQEGYFPRELMLLRPGLFVLRQAIEVA